MSGVADSVGRAAAAVPLVGDDIDTDRIMPARHLRAITFDGLEQHLFGDDRAHAASHGRGAPGRRSAIRRARR